MKKTRRAVGCLLMTASNAGKFVCIGVTLPKNVIVHKEEVYKRIGNVKWIMNRIGHHDLAA
jgi:hypothetical protein